MRKLLTVVLTAFLFVVSVGIHLTMATCLHTGNKQVLFVMDNCGCPPEEGDNCCKKEKISFQLDQDYKLDQNLSTPTLTGDDISCKCCVCGFHQTAINQSIALMSQNLGGNYPPPLDYQKPPVTITYQVFII